MMEGKRHRKVRGRPFGEIGPAIGMGGTEIDREILECGPPRRGGEMPGEAQRKQWAVQVKGEGGKVVRVDLGDGDLEGGIERQGIERPSKGAVEHGGERGSGGERHMERGAIALPESALGTDAHAQAARHQRTPEVDHAFVETERRVDMFEPFDGSALPPGDRAIFDGEVPDPRWQPCRLTRQGFEIDFGLDEAGGARLELAGEKWPERKLDLDRAKLDGVGHDRPQRVGEADLVRGEARAREQAEGDRSLDGEGAPGGGFDLACDEILEEGRVDDRREGNEHHGQEASEKAWTDDEFAQY